jgi:hypothetical protein
MEVSANTTFIFCVRCTISGSRPGSILAGGIYPRLLATDGERRHMLKKISGMATMYFRLMVQRRIILAGRATMPRRRSTKIE